MPVSKTGLKLLGGRKPYQECIKIVRKQARGKAKPINIIEKIHERWFFNLDPKYFRKMSQEYTENKLKLELPDLQDYDEAINYFKTLPPDHLKLLATLGQGFIPTEAYAALSRWHDIIGNPHRIEKIHQSGLRSNKPDAQTKSIAQLALENDRLGVLKATRDKIAEKLDKGAGSRDTALLTREMTDIMTQIADYEKRLGPKKDTKLGSLLNDIEEIKTKRPSENGGGARHTSFRSRVTIKDVEDNK